jgi:hypothetical protein
MIRWLPIASACFLLATVAPTFAQNLSTCPDPNAPDCGISGGLTADQAQGDFHGLIMVNGQPGVLETAAGSGTEPGCGDCEWTIVLACVFSDPNSHDTEHACPGSLQSRQCRRGESLFRLYLSTEAVRNALVDLLCLGGLEDVVPVGDIAAADVERYLRDVTPPDLRITVQPPHGVLAGLPAYFRVQPPEDLAPVPFGGPTITETITITPADYVWHWGDGTAHLVTDDPGAPYPDGRVTHTYLTAGEVTGTLTTRWGATYTITVAGGTYGPYDATGGAVDRTQAFTVTVTAARSHLVSGH